MIFNIFLLVKIVDIIDWLLIIDSNFPLLDFLFVSFVIIRKSNRVKSK